MRDGGRSDSIAQRTVEPDRVVAPGGSNEVVNDGSSFMVGQKGNKVNVMLDEDGIALFKIERDALGIVGEVCIVLTKEMLEEIYRRCRSGV